MSRFIIILLVLFLNNQLIAVAPWQLVRYEDDIRVFIRQSPGTLIKFAKGTVVIQTDLEDLLAVLEDTKTFPRWLYNCKSAKTIKQVSLIERYDYILTDMPWPNWDRDVIVRSVFQQDLKTKRVEIMFNALSDMIPLKPGVVRIKTMTGRMIITPQKGRKLHVIYEVNADPGGRIPKWLVNDMVVDFPFFTLKNLREYMEKKRNHK